MNTPGSARILIVDDTPTNIEVLLGMLEDDYDLSFATSGQQALDLLTRSERPDLILLDVMMPDMDGYAVCEALRANPATRGIPVIFVTAKTDPASETRALSAGGVDFIHKPVNKAVALARINLHLALEQRTRALTLANEELAGHRDHFEELVHARTRELAEARDGAESANRAKSAFLANMGHELRTPLNHIMGQVYLLQREHQGAALREHLAVIDRASRQLLQIIKDLLDLSRIEADRLTLTVGDFDPLELCEQALEGHRELAAARGIQLVGEFDQTLPPRLQGDRHRLGQILANLLNNAIKFSEHGIVRLRVSGAEAHGGALTVCFAVVDQGIGIAPELQARLFQPFYQCDATATRRYAGTGLGLALCKRLVALMAGEIGVESTPGQGSTFWFKVRFPLGAPPATAGAGTAPPGLDREHALRAVAELSALLADGDVEAQVRYAESPAPFDAVLGGQAGAFREALAAFDFDRARQVLNAAAQGA